MPQERLRLGFVGLGRWAETLAEAAGRSGAVELAACYTRTAEKRAPFARRFGAREAGSLDALLGDEEIEGVVIAAPHGAHGDLIRAAASAGKHIFVEKPLTLTVEDGRRAVAAAEAAGVVLQVGHHRRKLPATRRVRALIDTGELGMLHQFEAHVFNANRQKPAVGWHDDPREWPLGGMAGRGVHMIDNLHYLAGPVRRVYAQSRPLLGATRLDDITTLALEMAGGALAYVGVSQVLPFSIVTAAFGTGGAAWSEDDGARLFVQRTGERRRAEVPIGPGDALAEQFAEFARCVRVGARPETGGPEALEVVAVMAAAVESARGGRPVDVGGFRR